MFVGASPVRGYCFFVRISSDAVLSFFHGLKAKQKRITYVFLSILLQMIAIYYDTIVYMIPLCIRVYVLSEN